MKLLKLLFFFSLFFSSCILSQEKDSLRNALDTKFESFEYKEAISISNKLLASGENFTLYEQIEILRIKGVALYNLAYEDSARFVFIQLLKLNNDYSLDPVKNSPKIVEFFNNIKVYQKDFAKKESNNNEPVISENPKEVFEISSKDTPGNNVDFKGLIVRSILIPGWGHLEGGKSFKGWVLGTAGLISLSSMVYSIIDCSKKEKEYLTNTDILTIDDKYNSYNKAYKLRNISIAAYAIIWVYSQVDLIYISNFEINTGVTDSSWINSDSFCISYKIYF